MVASGVGTIHSYIMRKIGQEFFFETNPRGVKMGGFDHGETFCEVRLGIGCAGIGELGDVDDNSMRVIVGTKSTRPSERDVRGNSPLGWM